MLTEQLSGKTNSAGLYIDTVKEADVANRYNYQKGDYRNYKDGDLQSALPQGGDWTTPDDKEASLRMYAQDQSAGSTDYRNPY